MIPQLIDARERVADLERKVGTLQLQVKVLAAVLASTQVAILLVAKGW